MSEGRDLDEQARAERLASARISMTIGGLMAVLCGSCTVVVIGNDLASRYPSSGLDVIALIVGGFPAAVGGFLFLAGLRTYRQSRPPSPPGG
ncbi:MAG: hypothetical protein ACHP84_18700 [Caulobacterales bacterium]